MIEETCSRKGRGKSLPALVGAVNSMLPTLMSAINVLREYTGEACDSASRRVEDTRLYLAKFQSDLSQYLADWKERFTAEEFQRIAENCAINAEIYYNELSLRGIEALGRLQQYLDVDQASEALENYFDRTAESAQEILTLVTRQATTMAHQAGEMTTRATHYIDMGGDHSSDHLSAVSSEPSSSGSTPSGQASSDKGNVTS